MGSWFQGRRFAWCSKGRTDTEQVAVFQSALKVELSSCAEPAKGMSLFG